jgi:hypothetical protein
MRQQMTAAGARGLVVGLSGGLDSAVVARLAQLAAPSAVVAAMLPCHQRSADDVTRGRSSHFSLTTVRIDHLLPRPAGGRIASRHEGCLQVRGSRAAPLIDVRLPTSSRA